MKFKNVLTVIVFMAAIGGAIASEYLVPSNAYSKKGPDIPAQTANCELRGQCDGTASLCEIAIDHDNDPGTLPVPRQMYSAAIGTCGVELRKN